MKKVRILKLALISLGINLAFGIYNLILGFISHTWWFITLGVYYMILGVMRFAILKFSPVKENSDTEFIRKFTGIMFLIMAYILIGVTVLSSVTERGTKYGEIVMITIALYTFSKITIAIMNLVKSTHAPSAKIKILRNISFADAVVSLMSLQRSMLVSFEGMAQNEIRLFNILLGSAVSLVILLLGINLLGGIKIDMAKSKLVKANEKIADTVVGGYKKVEGAVVDTYTKIEDKFVGKYLTHEGESVEDAKKRLKNPDKN